MVTNLHQLEQTTGEEPVKRRAEEKIFLEDEALTEQQTEDVAEPLVEDAVDEGQIVETEVTSSPSPPPPGVPFRFLFVSYTLMEKGARA